MYFFTSSRLTLTWEMPLSEEIASLSAINGSLKPTLESIAAHATTIVRYKPQVEASIEQLHGLAIADTA